ncbi:CENP-S associating centromere protein X-domain-containing protein [Mucor mucedo]|uniref:CENP-S associating centromere protein X-domain-containing protein n=1 Tax=Mucor mucedo TaxID=29922 RepID=UPI00221EA359|nr:CENP-S associating centromere protein X-domain-containing protein [Mucor mucedo]KAI7892191.1 CENP-S associating centromere protein X-domain-containing protein [Mucor mucedo]
MNKENPIQPATVQKVFKESWKHNTTKSKHVSYINKIKKKKLFHLTDKKKKSVVNKDALQLSCEFLRLFVTEAVHRSAKEQEILNSGDTIDVEHLERILPQLLLDF